MASHIRLPRAACQELNRTDKGRRHVLRFRSRQGKGRTPWGAEKPAACVSCNGAMLAARAFYPTHPGHASAAACRWLRLPSFPRSCKTPLEYKLPSRRTSATQFTTNVCAITQRRLARTTRRRDSAQKATVYKIVYIDQF